MLTLIASGTHLAVAIGGVFAAVPVPGQYFSFTKTVLALVLFGVLARIMTWTDADLARLHGPSGTRTLWNAIMFAMGLIAVIILFFIPNFLVAVLLFVAVTAAGLSSYAFWRNALVAEVARVRRKKPSADAISKATAASEPAVPPPRFTASIRPPSLRRLNMSLLDSVGPAFAILAISSTSRSVCFSSHASVSAWSGSATSSGSSR